MRQLTLLTFLVLTSILGFSQSEIPQISTVCKDIMALKQVKFQYVVHAKGSELLLLLRKEDISSCKGLSATPFSSLVLKDSTLKKLSKIPEGQYAEWNNVINKWEVKNGGIEEISENIKKNRPLGDCLLAHSGRFKYKNYPDPTAYIIRTEDKHIEHYNNDLYSSSFQIKWISDCEYELTFIETNDPQLSFIKKGDKLYVSIWNVTSQGYEYESNFKGIIQTGNHIKIE